MIEIIHSNLGDIGKVCMCKRILKEQTMPIGDIPFYKISTFGGKADCFISREIYEDYKTRFSFPKKGDILISAAGTIGRTVRYDGDDAFFQDSNIVWIDNDETKVTNDFLYYFYQTKPWVKTHGSTIERLYNDNIRSITISYPKDLNVQKAITGILKSIDAKIANNNAICADLEGMAKLLYDYWFVQFDFPDENGKPYKSSGGKMVWNGELKREIPEGWNVTTIGNLFRVTMGTSPAGKDINESGEGTPFYQGKTDFGFRYPATRTYSTAPVRFAEKNDTLLSVRAPVGALNRAIEKSCIGRGVSAIHSQFPSFAYYTCLVLQPLFEKFNGDGTTFGCIGRDDLLAIPVVSPALQVIESFEALVSQNDALIEKCEKENRDLVSLRDFLLPMLMNGQVKVG